MKFKISYDYNDILNDLKEDLADKTLKSDDFINIVRNQEPVFDNYKPITDYYYLDAKETAMLPLDFFYNREEFSQEEWDKMSEERAKQLIQIAEDEPNFEKVKVSDVIKEMEELNRVF